MACPYRAQHPLVPLACGLTVPFASVETCVILSPIQRHITLALTLRGIPINQLLTGKLCGPQTERGHCWTSHLHLHPVPHGPMQGLQ